MKELFKWMACHPDVTLEIEHVDAMLQDGYLQLTMRHKNWNYKVAEILIFDLIDCAFNPDDILLQTLDNHYKELIDCKAKEIDKRVENLEEYSKRLAERWEVHHENC